MPRMTRQARKALLADMTLCWQELNTVLQIIGEAAHRVSLFGAGRKLKRRLSIDARELLEDIELE